MVTLAWFSCACSAICYITLDWSQVSSEAVRRTSESSDDSGTGLTLGIIVLKVMKSKQKDEVTKECLNEHRKTLRAAQSKELVQRKTTLKRLSSLLTR